MASYYKFNNTAELALLLATVFDITSGHDHDGTNSKSVTTGTPATNAVDTAQIKAGALAANAAGRAKMATGLFDAATVTDKFAADSFTNANLLQLVQNGAFAADASTRALFANAFMTPEKLTAIANTRVFSYQVEDLAANADITTRAIFECPAGCTVTITSASIISQGTAAGIDDSNTCVVEILNGTNSIASVEYDADPAFPAENATGSLGNLSETYKVLAAGEKLHLVVTNGTTANPPKFMLQVVYTVATAA